MTRNTSLRPESLAVRCYGTINRGPYGRDASFIANVILTSCSRPGKRLKVMVERLRRGQQFTSLSFRMPYEGFFIDGVAVRMEILDAPADTPLDQHRLEG